MLIIEQTLSNFSDPNFKDILLTEAINKLNPMKHFNSKILCKKVQENCNGTAFLDSRNLKFPIVNPKTCDVDCNILLSSYYALQKSSKSVGSADMLQEARDLIHKHNCRKGVKVKFEEENIEIDLDSLLFYLE